jgi:hypothetical protein
MTPKYLLSYCIIALIASATILTDAQAADVRSRAYTNSSCIIADEPFLLPETSDDTSARMAPMIGMIAAKLANALITGAIDRVSGGLNKRGGRKDTEYVTANNVNLYVADLSGEPQVRLNPEFRCATIVTGEIQPSDYDCRSEYIPREASVEFLNLPPSEWVTTREDNSVENILKRANVCVVGEVASVYEARIILSDDRTAYRVDSAGYKINSMFSTKSKSAKRNLFYTMEVVEPTADGDGRVLTMPLLDLGEVSAGTSSLGDTAVSSDWLLVPDISPNARRDFQSDTVIHQEVFGKIEALERVVTRDTRVLAGIEERAKDVSSNIRDALKDEMTDIEIRLIKSASMLEALRGEYADLPVVAEQYMPVTIRFGITESRSERKALQAIGGILEKNSEMLASKASKMINVERSLDGMPEQSELDIARAAYFDAKIALEIESPSAAADAERLQSEFEAAKQSFNATLIAEGLAPVE